MRYTEEQLRAIEAEGKVIVSASAGSGKTKIMIERILRLILSGKAGVSDLLAVTFTKKAATQMRERLRAALLDEIRRSAGELRARLKEELDLLPLAEISTVHSFCGKLIRTYFYLLPEKELTPDYRILTPEDAAGYQNKAMNAALERGFQRMDGGFRALLDVYYRGKRERALPAVVKGMYDAVRGYAEWEKLLDRAGEDTFDRAAQFLRKTFLRKAKDYERALNALRPAFEGNAPALKVIGSLTELLERAKETEGLYGLLALGTGYQRMPNQPKEEGEELRNWLALKDLNDGVKALFKDARTRCGDEETERERARKAGEQAAALARLAKEYAEEYDALKREAGALDYNDLEHYALALLQTEEVQREVRRRYRYVFVDEYQDVNPMQERILSCVAGENLFLVGDEKQAIYGFRGSKSEYFRKKREEFGGALPLTENFRSASGILDAVNAVFSPVVVGYEPMRGGRLYAGHTGEVYSHSIPKRREKLSIEGVYSVKTGRSAARRNPLADAVAEVVEGERGKLFYDLESGCFRPVEYGDIAVLVRKDTTDGKRIARALTEKKIPVTSSSSVNILSYYECRLVLDCLRFLDNAEEDIPFTAFMLSALGGFCDGELMEIRLAYPYTADFRSAVRRYASERTDALSHKINLLFRRAARLRALAKVRSAAQIISLLLGEGLEGEIAAKEDGHSRLLRVRRLVSEAEKCGGVHDFLMRIKENGEKIDYKESGGENAVKVLTMHAAKGLEFPVVVLASMETPLNDSDPAEVEWSENFLFCPRYYDEEKRTYHETFCRQAVKAEREREEDEGERNLLYVAMTRAKYRLHLMVEERRRASSPALYKRFSDYFGDRFTGEKVTEQLPPVEREAYVYEDEESEEEKVEILSALRIAEDYPYPDAVSLPEKSSATEFMKERGTQYAGARGGGSAEVGTAYHRFLQHYRFGCPPKEELARMVREGLFKEGEESLVDEEQLERIASLPCLKKLKGVQGEREKKFLLSLTPAELGYRDGGSELLFQGAIDLIFEDEEGYVIYDYKYSGLDGEQLKEKYAPQIEIYRKAVAKGKRVDEKTVRATIVNILKGEEIGM